MQTKGLVVKTTAFHGVERSAVGLHFLPKPDALEYALPKTHCVLVTNDGTDLTKQLLTQLQAKGDKIAVLNLPNIQNPISTNAVTLSAHTDEAIKTAIESIQHQFGIVGSFIHVHPHFEFATGNFTQHFAAERPILKTVFFLAKHLQKGLNELGVQQRANFLTVTRMDGQLGQGKRGNTSILGGGLTGLVKCLNLEWSSVFCRAVDIQPELATTTIANQIMAELYDADVRYVEVCYSEEGRQTSVATPVPVQEHSEIKTTVTADSVFLVSGGARGVTATCVLDMAKAFQCKFILLGRSSADFVVPDFAKATDDEGSLKRLIMTDMKERGEKPSLPAVKKAFKNIIAKKEIDATMNEIKAHGGQVMYIQGDVTKPASFKVSLANATTQLGKITGVIHGAGRLADKYIQDKTETDFENVLSVKLDGLLSLLFSVELHHLDHLILFSSVAGYYGNVGQTDYAIANEILSKAAHLFRTNHPNTQVSAINWGAWDSGMVSGELKAQFEAAGVVLVNSEGGAAMLVNELNTAYANEAQVIIGGTLPAAVSHIGDTRTHRLHRNLQEAGNPFLQHHVIQGKAVLPVVNAVGWMAHACESLYPDFGLHLVEDTKLFKGIVFDGSQKENYILELKELEKNDTQIVFETTVLSEGAKLPTYHYRAKITLVHRKNRPEAPTFTAANSGTYPATEGAVLYQDGSLFHGKFFQGIEQIIDCTETQMILSCKAPVVPLAEQGQFPINSVNTFFADIQYQGMVVWVQKMRGGAKSLPLKTEKATLYEPMPFNKSLFVHVNIIEATDYQLVATCTTYDENGKVYLITEGAAVTISKDLQW